jgi:hypothetical protein
MSALLKNLSVRTWRQVSVCLRPLAPLPKYGLLMFVKVNV